VNKEIRIGEKKKRGLLIPVLLSAGAVSFVLWHWSVADRLAAQVDRLAQRLEALEHAFDALPSVDAAPEHAFDALPSVDAAPPPPVITPPAKSLPEPVVKAAVWEQQVLEEYNKWRAAVAVPPLVWDKNLAAVAADWAQHLVGRCGLVHSGRPLGENLAKYHGSSLITAVGDWGEEVEDYNYTTGTCTGVCGHWTQIVWRGTERLGCGFSVCRNGDTILVCNYDPPGNTKGKKPY
jgi:pathogenesis-related protein 1